MSLGSRRTKAQTTCQGLEMLRPREVPQQEIQETL